MGDRRSSGGVDRVVEALAEAYLKRVAGVLVPKPYPVGIDGINALEDIGMNAGVLLHEGLDEIGSPCEHLRPFQLVMLAIIGAVGVRHQLYR